MINMNHLIDKRRPHNEYRNAAIFKNRKKDSEIFEFGWETSIS